jgi:hypothetical protein
MIGFKKYIEDSGDVIANSFKDFIEKDDDLQLLDEKTTSNIFVITSHQTAFLFVNAKRRFRLRANKFGCATANSDGEVKALAKEMADGYGMFIILTNQMVYVFINGKKKITRPLAIWQGWFAVKTDSDVKRKLNQIESVL